MVETSQNTDEVGLTEEKRLKTIAQIAERFRSINDNSYEWGALGIAKKGTTVCLLQHSAQGASVHNSDCLCPEDSSPNGMPSLPGEES